MPHLDCCKIAISRTNWFAQNIIKRFCNLKNQGNICGELIFSLNKLLPVIKGIPETALI